MVNELVVVGAGDEPLVTREDHKVFVEEFLKGRSPRTIKAYREDLLRAARWLKLETIDEFAKALLSRGPGHANRMAIAFKAWASDEKKWTPSYVNNHLAAFRSIVRFARMTGRIVWAMDVDDIRAEKFTDTRGPGIKGIAATLQKAREAQPPARASRDVAIIMLFAFCGLRRDEVVSLNFEHLDLEGKRVLVLRKKRKQRKWVTVPDFGLDALKSWLTFRGTAPGALFQSFAVRAQRTDKRLAESSVWWLIKGYALAAGVPKKQARPHGFRHAAITLVLELTDGNIRAAQLFADHSNPATTVLYDDNRKDVAGEMSNRLADKIGELMGFKKEEKKS